MKKIYIIGIIAVFLMGGGFIISLNIPPQQDIVLKKEVFLNSEERAFVENRLKIGLEAEAETAEVGSFIEKSNLYFAIASDYAILGEYGLAKTYYEKALAEDPQNANIMSSYSSHLAAMGDKKGALTVIDDAIDLLPSNSNLWRWKIALEMERGTSGRRLEKIYKTALEAVETKIDIISIYAGFLEEQKRYEEAIAQWEEAMTIYPANEALYIEEINRIKAIQA